MAQLVNTATHRANRLLAALEPEVFAFLEPHLEIIALHRRQVLYEAGETICYTYFPHDAVVSLVNVLEDGRSVEVAVFGREGVFGLISALFTRESFGRYIVQIPGTASQVEIEWLREAVNACPRMRLLLYRFTEALLAQTFQIVTCNAVHSVEARCCRWLLSTHDRVEQDTLPLTHEFLAEMLGTQRRMATRTTFCTSAGRSFQGGSKCCPKARRRQRSPLRLTQCATINLRSTHQLRLSQFLISIRSR
jgi:CRP-like cAMP-binding protein